MELYHIHKLNDFDPNFEVGNTFTVGQDYNMMTQFFLNMSPSEVYCPELKPEPYFDYTELLQEDVIDALDPESLKLNFLEFRKYIHTKMIDTRELLLELARLKINPNLPSRQKCMWLTDIESLPYWSYNFGRMPHAIYKLDVDGNIFESADHLLPNPNETHSVMMEQAEKYWQPTHNDLRRMTDREYLLEGQVRVLKRVK